MSCCGQSGKKNYSKHIYMNTKRNASGNDPLSAAAAVSDKGSACNPKFRARKKGCCLQLKDNDPIEYPDPSIYSQAEQLSLGQIPSWDNPDILTNEWKPFRLMMESKVIVRNLSPNVSAVNTLVHFSISNFGIGTVRTLIASKLISLPAAGQAELLFPLPQDVLSGDPRIGVHVHIEHPHDNNYQNNEGSQVHDGSYTSESGRNFTLSIPVYNDSNFAREIQLSLMSTDLAATVTPSTRLFAAHEQFNVSLHIQVPGFLIGTSATPIERAVTVVGRLTSGELIGGATKLLRIDN